MSKILENMRKETAVQGAINALRKVQISDSTILETIMDQFHLTEQEAQNYTLEASA